VAEHALPGRRTRDPQRWSLAHIQRCATRGIRADRARSSRTGPRDVAVVVITTRIKPEYVAAAVNAGCDGFLLLSASPALVAYEVERVVASRATNERALSLQPIDRAGNQNPSPAG